MSEISGGGGKPLPLVPRRPEQKSADVRLREVSDMYEKHFLREMTKAMRSTVQESGFIKSNHAEKIFREQLDEQYVEKWGERGGIGLSDMIYDQLVNKFGEQMGIKPKVLRPMGPIKMDGNSQSKAVPFQHPGKVGAVSYKYDVNSKGPDGSNDVKAPWDGMVKATKNLADNQTMLEIEHDNGLNSQVVFNGRLSRNLTGEKVQGGETLGFLNNEAKILYWTIEPVQKTGIE